MAIKKEEESLERNLRYPRAAIFNLVAFTLEKFARSCLFGTTVFYMQRVLEFSANSSSTIFATICGILYFAPIPGSILADVYFGKVRLILMMFICWIFGGILFSLTSLPFLFTSIMAKQVLGILGFLIVALSNGLIKAVFINLGPYQFQIPEQRPQQRRYFAIFYWLVWCSSLVGVYTTAQIRDSIQCFGEDCFAIPFWTATILMSIVTLLFFYGKQLYVDTPPDSTMIEAIKCISYATKRAFSNNKTKVKHWLDRSSEKFDAELINDVKCALKLLLVMTTLPFACTVSSVLDVGMIFQAKRMDRRIGTHYVMPPESISFINYLVFLLLQPICEAFVFPMFRKMNLFTKDSSKITISLTLIAIGCSVYGGLQLSLEQDLLGEQQGQLNIYNTRNCDVSVSGEGLPRKIVIDKGEEKKITPLSLGGAELILKVILSCNSKYENVSLPLVEKRETSLVIFPTGSIIHTPTDHYLKDVDADAKLRVTLDKELPRNTTVKLFFKEKKVAIPVQDWVSIFKVVNPRYYELKVGNDTINTHLVNIRQDGVFDIVVLEHQFYLFKMCAPSSLNIMWTLPYILILSFSEMLWLVLFDYIYSQVPASMKSIMQAFFMSVNSLGYFVFAILTKFFSSIKYFDHRGSLIAFIYSILLMIDTVCFYYLVKKFEAFNECKSILKEQENKSTLEKETNI